MTPPHDRTEATDTATDRPGSALTTFKDHKYSTAFIDRFWSRVNKAGPVPAHRPELGPCWLWTAAKIPEGYGSVSTPGKSQEGAHRVGYELQCGPIPPGLFVLHHCDTRLCIRGSHLFAGTQLDNMLDMISKGRAPVGDAHYARTQPHRMARGERHGNSILTAEKVSEIRIRLANCETRASVARRFGVAYTTIDRIYAGSAWVGVGI